MGKQKLQKISAILTMIIFIFSTFALPVRDIFAAGPYDVEGLDLSQYQLIGASTTPNGNDTTDPTANYLADTNTYNLNIGSISEALPAVIGCTGIVNKVKRSLSDLLSPSKTNPVPEEAANFKAGTGNYKDGYDDGSPDGSYSESEYSGITAGTNNVPITATEVEKKLKEQDAKLGTIKDQGAEDKIREECLNGVAYALAKGQLAKMTQITVNWINSGFNGDPLYIRDRDSYFQSLADDQLLNMVGPLANIQNQYIYPFGRDFARTIVNSRKSTYENRSQSTLSNSLRNGATTEDFANDFSTGGWDGWFSLTQNDQNNPIGFGIMTGQELANRIAQDEENAKAELAEGKGFLSQRQCVEYEKNIQSSPSDVGYYTGYSGNRTSNQNNGRCIRWETVTPGSIIQEQASGALTSSQRQLELADSLNESLSAVFQALVNQMVGQGLSSLSSFNPSNAPQTFGGPGSNKLYDSLGNDVSYLSGLGANTGNKTVLSVNKGRGWYNATGTFDITTDLEDIYRVNSTGKRYIYKKGIITTQRDYGEAVKLSLQTLPKILPALGKLDYCIPGPNPSWEEPAKERINLVIEYLQSLFYSNGSVISPWEDPLQNIIDFNSALTFGAFGHTNGVIRKVVDKISVGFGGQTQAQYEENLEKQFIERMLAKEKVFNDERKAAIQEQKDSFFWYKDRIDPLYGPGSPMRTPGNPWYLPMAEAGLQATRYIRSYEDNIKTATLDYKDLINQNNANIYKLTIIRNKVRVIVGKARARRDAEMMKKGLPVIDPSCYDITPGNKPNDPNIGSTGGNSNPGSQRPNDPNAKPTTGTAGQAPSAGGFSSGKVAVPAVPNFTIQTKANTKKCELELDNINTSTGDIASYTWGIKLITRPNVYGSSSKDFSYTIRTDSIPINYDTATVTLSVRDLDGKTKSLSKNIQVKKSPVQCP